MSKFEDSLWRDLVDRHGSDLEQMAATPEGGGGPPRRRLLAGTSLGLAGAGTAAVLIVSAASSAPAFAVSRNADGTVTVLIRRIEGISGANERLHKLGIRVQAVQVAAGCSNIPPALALVHAAASGKVQVIRPGAIERFWRKGNVIVTAKINPGEDPRRPDDRASCRGELRREAGAGHHRRWARRRAGVPADPAPGGDRPARLPGPRDGHGGRRRRWSCDGHEAVHEPDDQNRYKHHGHRYDHHRDQHQADGSEHPGPRTRGAAAWCVDSPVQNVNRPDHHDRDDHLQHNHHGYRHHDHRHDHHGHRDHDHGHRHDHRTIHLTRTGSRPPGTIQLESGAGRVPGHAIAGADAQSDEGAHRRAGRAPQGPRESGQGPEAVGQMWHGDRRPGRAGMAGRPTSWSGRHGGATDDVVALPT